jgi:hypothetical protein
MPLTLLLILRINQPFALQEISFFWGLSGIFLLAGIPFFLGGIAITLALTLRANDAGRIYGADLVGAACGALVTVPLAGLLPVPYAILVAALLLAVIPLVLNEGLSRSGRFLLASIACLCIAGAFMADQSHGLLQVSHAKGREQKNLFEKWNAFSRVTVKEAIPFRGWARTKRNSSIDIPDQLQIQIDAWGKTPITRFDGADITPIEFLKYDITALPFFLVTPRQVLNIGAGGGKDVLTALAFDTEEITAVELNPIIVENIMLDKYSEFSGNLFRHPRVRPVVDEGRGFLRTTSKQFDIIQLSLTHTFSGALAGALSLTENNIYTVESFKEMIDRLSPGGLLTVTYLDEGTKNSRLTLQGGTRIAGIASAALQRLGIEEPQQHMLAATHQRKKNKGIKFINVMVSKTPLNTETVEKFHRLSQNLGFTVALSPLQSADSNIQQIVDPKQRSSFLLSYPLDLSPTTDNRPFFLYQNKLGDISDIISDFMKEPHIREGMSVLVATLAISLIGVMALLVLPILFFAHRDLKIRQPALVSWLAYFSCLGIGFMLVEITMLQQLVLLLSHPIHTLAISLTVLLFTTGLGSLLVSRFSRGWIERYGGLLMLAVAATLLLYLVIYNQWVELFIGSGLPLRIVATVLLIAPVGLMLGMPMPMAIRRISQADAGLIPWGWALNGAASVLGSGLAMALSLHFGYRVTLLASVSLYVIAAGFFLLAVRTQKTVT